MNGFRNGKLYRRKLNLVGAVFRYRHRDLLWKDMYLMGMNHLEASLFQKALKARLQFEWAIGSWAFGFKENCMNQTMLNYNQALKNLERLEQM